MELIGYAYELSSNVLVFVGKYNIWSDITLNMTEMSVLETNKEAVLSHFGLKIEQTQLFVALAGGLYSSYENVQVKTSVLLK